MIIAMARASCPRRALVLRSVLRRGCPKFDSHELARSAVQRVPKGAALGARRCSPRGRFLARAASAVPWLGRVSSTGLAL